MIVTATAAWFLWSAHRRGIIPTGREAEHASKWRTFRDFNWSHGFSDDLTGWSGYPGFPYEQGQTVLQDPWHHAATVWPLYEMDPATGIKAMNGHFGNYSSSANADLVVYDCSRISSNLLSQTRSHAFPPYNTQAERLQSLSRWTIMALRVHRACYSIGGEPKALGDFDRDGNGDNRDDFVTWRPSNGTWWVSYASGAPALQSVQWGLPGDIPLLGDIDGDNRDDFVIRRPSSGTWWVSYASGASPLCPASRRLPTTVALRQQANGQRRMAGRRSAGPAIVHFGDLLLPADRGRVGEGRTRRADRPPVPVGRRTANPGAL